MNHPTNDVRTDRQKYWDAIETLADVVEDEARLDDTLEISELVFEMVDSSTYVIHHSKNLKALQYSHNEPSEFKHLISDGDSWREVVQAMAFQVVKFDLYDELRERDSLEEV